MQHHLAEESSGLPLVFKQQVRGILENQSYSGVIMAVFFSFLSFLSVPTTFTGGFGV